MENTKEKKGTPVTWEHIGILVMSILILGVIASFIYTIYDSGYSDGKNTATSKYLDPDYPIHCQDESVLELNFQTSISHTLYSCKGIDGYLVNKK